MKIKLWLALLLPCLLAACALEPKRIDTPPDTRIIVQPALPSEAEQLLNHMVKMRRLEAREFTTERENARNLFQHEKSDFNRIRYALMLTFPASTSTAVSTQDDADVINLMEPLIVVAGVANGTMDSEVRLLATLLHSAASDRRKMREQLRDTQARLTLAKKDDIRDAENRALRARVDELEAKLNALKSIDRSLNRRAESPGK